MFKSALLLIFSSTLLLACVTNTINSDGTLQSNKIDKDKLADTYIDLAIEYQQHNAPQVALNRANLAVETAPSNPKGYMIRAMIYQQLGQDQVAEADFKHAIKLDSNYSEAYVNYAVFLCDHQRYAAAYPDFAVAIANPLYSMPEIAYYSRGNCYFLQGNYAQANNDFLKVFSYRNPPANAYVAMARLQFIQKNYPRANYYINKYSAGQTAASIWLHIQILQALLVGESQPAKIREYTSYRNTLGQLLTKNYAETPEAQQYILNFN